MRRDEEPKKKLLCRVCLTEITPTAKFCPGCGRELDTEEYSGIAPTTPPAGTQPNNTVRNMWVITLIVIVALFVICVILFYSTTFTLKPAD